MRGWAHCGVIAMLALAGCVSPSRAPRPAPVPPPVVTRAPAPVEAKLIPRPPARTAAEAGVMSSCALLLSTSISLLAVPAWV